MRRGIPRIIVQSHFHNKSADATTYERPHCCAPFQLLFGAASSLAFGRPDRSRRSTALEQWALNSSYDAQAAGLTLIPTSQPHANIVRVLSYRSGDWRPSRTLLFSHVGR